MSILHLNKETFVTEVTNSKNIVMVDFWAPWCGPCRRLGPVIEELGEEVRVGITIAKVDVDAEPALAEQFEVVSIPTIIVFKDGKIVSKTLGLQTKAQLEKLLQI